jgi:Cytochrome P460
VTVSTRVVSLYTLFTLVGGLFGAVSIRAAGDRVAFPENYARGTLYWTQDRPQNKQVREYYVNLPGAIEAAKSGRPLPDGTVITVVQYNVRQDAAGNPVTENGRFVKTDIRGYTAMEKRAGWGAAYPPETRNGDWEYQSFTAMKTPNTTADLKTCFTCHTMVAGQDFVYSVEQLKGAAR